jgi:probable HAF family extracellular repeat protein
MRDLGSLGWTGSSAYYVSAATSINSKSQVVGWSLTSAGAVRAFLWETGRMRRLTGLENAVGTAYGIDVNRRVAGEFGSSTIRGFRWNGAVSSIGTFGGPTSTARAINDQGKVVGWADMSTGAQRAFLWQNGVMTNLRTLGGRSSKAYGINGLGHIVGESQVVGSRHLHGFLLKNGVMYDLGLGTPTGINQNGWIVGSRIDPASTSTTLAVPTLWKPTATPPPPPAPGLVKIGNFWFASARNGSWNPAVDTVPVGRTVTWELSTGSHTVQSVGSPSFTSSGTMKGSGTKHTFTFRQPGTYQYNCAFHPRSMFGQIIVR